MPNTTYEFNYFSDEIEDFPAFNEHGWNYYGDIPYATNEETTPTENVPMWQTHSQGEEPNDNEIPHNWLSLNNDTKHVSRHDKNSLIPNSSNQDFSLQDLNFHIDWNDKEDYYNHQQHNGRIHPDPNCTEEVWNVTLVPSSLRKNTLYLTVSEMI